MKNLLLVLLITSLLGTGISSFFFTKIRKVIDKKLEEIGELTNENQLLERAIVFERKKFSEVQISLSETKAILATTKRNSARSVSSLSSLEDRFSNLSKKFEASKSLNESLDRQVSQLEDTIFDIDSQKDSSREKIAELVGAIKKLRNQNQIYQSKIQELGKNIVVFEESKPNDLDNYFLVHFLAIDLTSGLVSIDLKRSSRIKDGTKIVLKSMGFTIGRLKIIEIGEDYVIGNVEPGINRFSSFNAGDTADVILPEQV